jgi:hypothetical protein
MIAILKDAVECLDKYRGARNSSGRSHYENALEWVQDKGTEWLFSFTNICDLLGFDPDYSKCTKRKINMFARQQQGLFFSVQ